MKRKSALVRSLSACILFLLVCAGCTNLPTAGPVQSQSPRSEINSFVGLVARPPMQDASPEQIVSGFFDALAAGLGDNFEVARSYLIGSLAKEWDPLSVVNIYPDSQNIEPTTTANGAIRVNMRSVGSLDSQGFYTESPSGSSMSADFSLAKDAQGQWRIVKADNGIFLSEHLFEELYVQSPVYFYDSTNEYLVGEPHWFSRASAPTGAMRALLAGPSSWLSNGTRTFIPANTTLAKAVESDGTRAKISLSSQALSLNGDEKGKMYAQIYTTLTSLPTLTDISVSVEGSRFEVSDAPTPASYPYGTYSLAVVRDGIPSLVKDDDAVALIGADPTFGDIPSLGLHHLAASYDSEPEYAAIDNNNENLYRITPSHAGAAQALSVLYSGAGLTAPSYDIHGWLWTASGSESGKIIAIHTASQRFVHIAVPWLEGATVKGIAVSREGARVALIVSSGDSDVIYIASIQRNEEGEPAALGEPKRIGQSLKSAEDMAWVAENDLVVLASSPEDEESALYRVSVGGLSEKISTPPSSLVQVSAGRGEESLVGITGSHNALGRSAGAWRLILGRVSSLAYPG